MHTLTFDQVERNADRTLAIVLWARHARNVAETAAVVVVVNRLLRSLVKSLACDAQLSSITDEQARELTEQLQEIYSLLELLLRRQLVLGWKDNPVLGSSVRGIEDSAESLGDIIEDLVLSCNQDFRSVIADCAKSIRASHSAELIGTM